MRIRVGDRRAWTMLVALFVGAALFGSSCAADETGASSTTSTETSAAEDIEAIETTQPTETTATTEAPPTEVVESTYNGIPAGFTDDGYPYLGDIDAPVSLIEFSDYLCPFCGRHATETNPQLMEQYGASGQVRFEFRDYPLAELHPTAPAGHAAAVCVAEQGPALFWAMHERLFARQSQWAQLADSRDFLAGVADEVGADLDAYRECVNSGRAVDVVDQRVADARQLGFSGTPGFQIVDNRNGEVFEVVGAQPLETFVAAIEAVIAGDTPVAEDPPEERPDLPIWASEEGLAVDPDRPGYNLAGDAFQGDPSAPLVVIEISDFQCPFCQRHALETQPLLEELYVDTGQVMWVFKHMPLPFHQQALAAATAAECAGDQEAFWEMHDLLFERVVDWAVEPPDPPLVDLAAELGLDRSQFAACVASRTALERVVEDLYETSEAFGSTPIFVLVSDGWASVIDGARPFEEFAAAFDELLSE